jgi:hypothetical protein
LVRILFFFGSERDGKRFFLGNLTRLLGPLAQGRMVGEMVRVARQRLPLIRDLGIVQEGVEQ